MAFYPFSILRQHLTFEFEKRCQFFVGSNDESLSVVAVRVNNEDRSPVRIHA